FVTSSSVVITAPFPLSIHPACRAKTPIKKQSPTRRADDPEDDDELESQGFVIKQGPGVLRHARRESMIETTDAEDPNPSYIIDWGRVACIAITDADPDPEAEH
ncbi:hypothetical protein, partial [Williamsia muralis]|uniref:hypothetical protein n=1 Tax=Williamsia marianensis TaxID=85044 RepID=UPI000DE774F1